MKGIKNNMGNNEDLKQKLDELRGKRSDLKTAMNNLESQKVQGMVEISNLDEEIAKVEADIKEAERLHDELMEAERLAAEKKKAEQEEAVRLNTVIKEAEKRKAEQLEAERLEAERQEAEKKKAEQKKFQTMTDSDYSKMLANYNQRIKVYNNEVAELYRLQNLYEQGQIKYSTYIEYAMPLTQKEIYLKKDYAQLNELYNKLSQSKSLALSTFTKEELQNRYNDLDGRLNKLNNEFQQRLSSSSNNGNVFSVTRTNYDLLAHLQPIQSNISDIKEQKNNISRYLDLGIKDLNDDELLLAINGLDNNLSEAMKQGNISDENIKNIKTILQWYKDDLFERKSKKFSISIKEQNDKNPKSIVYASLTKEQIDNEIAKLNEEYLDEWNYSVHQANGMEDNSAKLEEIKLRINTLNYIKMINVSNLEKPKAPLKAMFISEKTKPTPSNEQPNTDLSQDAENPTPEIVTPEPEPVIPEVPAPQDDISEPSIPESPASQDDIPEIDTPPKTDSSTSQSNSVIDPKDPYAGRPRVSYDEEDKKNYVYTPPSSNGKWYQRLGNTIKGIFSKAKPKHLPAGLKDEPQNSGNADYDDSDMNTYEPKSNPYFEELKAPDNSSSTPPVIKDSSGNITIDVIPPDNSSKQPVNPNPNRGQGEISGR